MHKTFSHHVSCAHFVQLQLHYCCWVNMYPRLVMLMYLALQLKMNTCMASTLLHYRHHRVSIKKKIIATYICIVNRHFLRLLVPEIQCVYNPTTTTSLLSPFYFTCNKNLHAFPHLVVSMLSLVCLFGVLVVCQLPQGGCGVRKGEYGSVQAS